MEPLFSFHRGPIFSIGENLFPMFNSLFIIHTHFMFITTWNLKRLSENVVLKYKIVTQVHNNLIDMILEIILIVTSLFLPPPSHCDCYLCLQFCLTPDRRHLPV